jgi:hypothetical protein
VAPLNGRIVGSTAIGTIDLTATPGERTVTQIISSPVSLQYSADTRADYASEIVGEVISAKTKDLQLTVSHSIAGTTAIYWLYRARGSIGWVRLAATVATKTTLTTNIIQNWNELKRVQPSAVSKLPDIAIDYMAQITKDPSTTFVLNSTSVQIISETNIWVYPQPSSHASKSLLLLLLLLVPGIAVPAVAVAVHSRKGASKYGNDESGGSVGAAAAVGGGTGAVAGAGAEMEAGNAADSTATYIGSGVKPIHVVDSKANQ